MKKGIWGIVIFLVSLGFRLYAGEASPLGLFPQAYGGLGVGARPLGMGGAFITIANSPEATYWNPAGLGQIPYIMGIAAYTAQARDGGEVASQVLDLGNYLSNYQFNYFGLVGRAGGMGWGVSTRSLANFHHTVDGNSPQTLRDEGIEEVEFAVNEYVLSLSSNLGGLFYGGNFKYLDGQLGIASVRGDSPRSDIAIGRGVGFDGGLLYSSPTFRTGVVLRNLYSAVWWEGYKKEDLLKPTVVLGASTILFGTVPLAFDVEKPFSYSGGEYSHFTGAGSPVYRVGVEPIFFGALALRLGTYGFNPLDPGSLSYTAGLGYNWSGYELDLSVAGENIDRLRKGGKFFTYTGTIVLPISPIPGE
ncbi:MAG: hypothetical protein ACUVXI_08495 [bacterium]